MEFDLSTVNWFSLFAFLPILVLALRPGKKRRSEVILVALMSLTLFIAWSGVFQLRQFRGDFHLFLIDRSGSSLYGRDDIEDVFRETYSTIKNDSCSGDRYSVLLYGDNTVISTPVSAFDTEPDPFEGEAGINRSGTDLQAAVYRGLSLAPESYRVNMWIIGDGTADQRNVYVPGDISCSFIQAGGAQKDAALTGIKVPERISTGEPFTVSVFARSSIPMSSEIALYNAESGRIISSASSRFAFEKERFDFQTSIEKPGYAVLMAEIVAEHDNCPENNVVKKGVKIIKRTGSDVLVVGEPLTSESTPLDRVEISDFNRGSAELLQQYSAVVLNDVPADSLDPHSVSVLGRYIQSFGRGLVVTGSSRIFGPGGYRGTELEKILPLNASPRVEGLSKQRVMIAVDRSGSMSGRLGGTEARKIDAARAAALEFILKRGTSANRDIGFMLFSAEQEVLKAPEQDIPLTSIKERFDELGPYGGTRIISAINRCIRILNRKEEPEEELFIFIITDGLTREVLTSGEVDSIVQDLRSNDIRLFILNIGESEKNSVLQGITEKSEGEYHVLGPGEQISVEFFREADSVMSEYMYEKISTAVACPGAPVLGYRGPDEFSCRSYIRTSLHPGALCVLKNKTNSDPLAAMKYIGLGRTCAVAGVDSDYTGLINGHMISWAAGIHAKRGVSLSMLEKGDGLYAELTLDNVPAPGKQVIMHLMHGNDSEKSIRLLRQTPHIFAGKVAQQLPSDSMYYSITIDSRHISSGIYIRPYSREFNPSLRQNVHIIRSGASGVEKGSRPAYLPFMTLFVLLFAVYEVKKFAKRHTTG